MVRRASILALFFVACGQDAPVRFASEALGASTHRLALYYFEPEKRCSELWASSDRSQALHGPFASEPLDDDERENGFTFPMLELPSGTYVIVVDALSASDILVGSGCAESQQVLERRLSFTEIVIHPVE
jgi:hypothetical protein